MKNLPIEEKVKGYGYLHKNGEFEFTPVRKGVKTGKMRIVKQGNSFTYYEGKEHGKITIVFKHNTPPLYLFSKLCSAIEEFIIYFRKHTIYENL